MTHLFELSTQVDIGVILQPYQINCYKHGGLYNYVPSFGMLHLAAVYLKSHFCGEFGQKIVKVPV